MRGRRAVGTSVSPSPCWRASWCWWCWRAASCARVRCARRQRCFSWSGGFFLIRIFFDPAVDAIERVDSARTGYLGGAGLPIILSWAVGGLLAAGAAWLIGKVALGLRADYFAIATLGIAEIVITVIKNEDWLGRA